MEKEYLLKERNILVADRNKIRNTEKETYQEKHFYQLQTCKLDLIDALINLTNQTSKNTILSNLNQHYAKYFTCLLSFTQQIAELIPNYQLFTITHKHNYSQSILLALILAKESKQTIKLFTNNHNQNGVSQMLADDKQVDKISWVKDCLKKENVEIIDINDPINPQEIGENDIVVVDLFEMKLVDHLPLLLTQMKAFKKASKTFFYFSHYDSPQLQFLKQSLQSDDECKYLHLQVIPQHPVNTNIYKDAKQMQLALIGFLQQDSVRPERLDILIFYPVQTSLSKYLTRLREMLFKAALKEKINLIYQKHQQTVKGQNNIFIMRDYSQLKQMIDHFDNFVLVLDYGEEFNLKFDYQHGCYIQSIGMCSISQKIKRLSMIGVDRIGLYYTLQKPIDESMHYGDQQNQLSSFIVKMIAYGLVEHIALNHERVKACLKYLEYLKIIQKYDDKYTVVDKRIVKLAQKGVMPIQAKLFLDVIDQKDQSQQQKQRNLNIIAMTVVAIKSQGDLRLIKKELQGSHIKPYAVWRKSGYIESCIDILTKCQLIELRKQTHRSKSQQFQKIRSKMSERKYQANSSIFEPHEQGKKSFSEMQISDLIRQYTVNEELLFQMRESVQFYREHFQFESCPILLEREDIQMALKCLLHNNQSMVCFYSGSKNREYVNGKEIIPLSDSSLINLLNQRPESILTVRMQLIEGHKKIKMTNAFPQQLYIEQFGAAPYHRKKSLQEVSVAEDKERQQTKIVEQQIEMDSIPTAYMGQLIQHSGILIDEFQKDNNCHLQMNIEQGKILIHCYKDDSIDRTVTRANFNQLIKTIKNKNNSYTKNVHYMGRLNFVLGKGGKILEMMEKGYVNKCLLYGLPKEYPKEYIEIVLEDKFIMKSIQIIGEENFQITCSALVQFYTQKDYIHFQQYYEKYLQAENYFTMEPVTYQQTDKIKNKAGIRISSDSINQYIECKWYIWKSHCKGQVQFKTAQGVNNALQALLQNPYIDAAKIKVTVSDKNPLVIDLDCLNPSTDQIFIEEALNSYGQIESIQILKTPLKETSGDQQHLKYLIKESLKIQNITDLFFQPVQRKDHGLRICRVKAKQQKQMQKIAFDLDGTTNTLGTTRLHIKTWYEKPFLVPEDSLTIYMEMFEQTRKLEENIQLKVTVEVREIDDNNYLVLKCCRNDSLHFFQKKFQQKLRGVVVEIPQQARIIILSESGIANLLDMQEKYHCKIIISSITKTLRVLAKNQQINKIVEEIKIRLQSHFFYRVQLISKHYKMFKLNLQKLIKLQNTFELRLCELQEDSHALLMEGSAVNIQKAIFSLFQRVQKPNDETKKTGINDCTICGQIFQEPYRLECLHRFCKECLQQLFRFSLGDSSMFPLRCPQMSCRKEVSIVDLESLLEYGDWNKLKNLAANQYLKHNQDQIYCFTPGCEQINRIQIINMNGLKNEHTRCDICRNLYCVKCFGPYHPARSCKQAKMSEDQLLKKYMSQFNVRRCANPKCKVLCQRYTGCYKVQCSRCSTCMCFKCPQKEMIPYATADECYRHLSDMHGGYF